MESSLPTAAVAPLSTVVLNALRHQWNPHLGCSLAPPGRVRVLNALRHQWNPHDARQLGHDVGVQCSTPCGINGILTTAASRQSAYRGVLNALRHQWNPHCL